MLKKNIAVWSAFTASLPDEEPFIGSKYPDEQIVRFLATWKRRRRNDYFIANIGCEDDDAGVTRVKALEINPLNPVHLEAMYGFGFEPQTASYMPAAAANTRKGLERLDLSQITVKNWDGMTLPYADASMDAVLSTKSAYYQANQDRFVSEVARIVRPGGEIFLYYLSADHGYMDSIDHIDGNIYCLNKRHPNPALVGAYVFLASKEALRELWHPYFDGSIKYFEFSTYQTFSSFYVVTGQRRPNELKGYHETSDEEALPRWGAYLYAPT